MDDDLGPEPTPRTDPAPEVGPGGVDAVPDWEAAGPDPLTPDQPRSAQVTEDEVPDEIDEPEDPDQDESGSSPAEDPSAEEPD